MTTKLKRQIWKCNKMIENKEALNLEDFMEKVFSKFIILDAYIFINPSKKPKLPLFNSIFQ